MSHFTVLVDVCNRDYIEDKVENVLAPFWEQTEDPDYLTFCDCTQEVKNDYQTKGCDCIKTPGGKIFYEYAHEVNRYSIRNGVVVERQAGPLKREKRTKRAKKHRALINYPFRKLYPSIDDFAEQWCHYSIQEEIGSYGYYTNPNSFWDWYQIGGRWPFAFLVQEDCPSAYRGERSWCMKEEQMPHAPEGYVWEAAAAKKDIAWELQKSLHISHETKRYERLKEIFASGKLPQDVPFLAITDEGIAEWGKIAYKKDETLEAFLERNDLGPGMKYSVGFYGYVESGTYYSRGDMGWWGISSNDKDGDVWRDMLQQHIESIPAEHILVSVDCHV